jgi:transposase-like protein
MPKKGHSEEQILRALRQAEAGTRVSEICREHGISDATFYIWKKKYSGLGLSASKLDQLPGASTHPSSRPPNAHDSIYQSSDWHALRNQNDC